MKRKVDGLDVAAGAVHVADKILDVIIAVLLLCALLYGGFGLWDDYKIFNNANVSDEVLKYKPKLGKNEQVPAQENSSFSELQAINPDVCAWLTIDGTGIDYPVVHGESNTEYLNKSVDGSFLMSGSIFLDYRNNMDFEDFYSLIYGHHMANKKMFGELPEFMNKAFFDSHKEGVLFLPHSTYKIEVFACVLADGYDPMIFYPDQYEDGESRQKLLDYIKEHSVQYTDMGITPSDKIIGLSTCYEATTNGRVIVFGKLNKL